LNSCEIVIIIELLLTLNLIGHSSINIKQCNWTASKQDTLLRLSQYRLQPFSITQHRPTHIVLRLCCTHHVACTMYME